MWSKCLRVVCWIDRRKDVGPWWVYLRTQVSRATITALFPLRRQTRPVPLLLQQQLILLLQAIKALLTTMLAIIVIHSLRLSLVVITAITMHPTSTRQVMKLPTVRPLHLPLYHVFQRLAKIIIIMIGAPRMQVLERRRKSCQMFSIMTGWIIIVSSINAFINLKLICLCLLQLFS